MSKTTLLIDGPTPFAPLSEWTAFLAELQDLAKEHGLTPQLEAAIREAQTMIAEGLGLPGEDRAPMTRDEFNTQTNAFRLMVDTLDITSHQEHDAEGRLIINGFIDSVQWVKSEFYVTGKDADGTETGYVLHWINVRWAGFEDTRLHVRHVVSYEADRYSVTLRTHDGRRLLEHSQGTRPAPWLPHRRRRASRSRRVPPP